MKASPSRNAVVTGIVTQRDTPNSSPTPATPANSVSKAPIEDASRVPAETRPQPRPNCSRMSLPCPFPVTTPSRTTISWAMNRIGISTSWGRTIA